MFTYDQAEEKTKEQMKLQELDLKNKKVYNTMRKNWKLKLLTEYNYEQIADVYKAMLNDKNRVLEERAKLLTQLKNIKPENFASVSQQTDAFVEQLTKTLELKDNKTFVSGMNEVTALFDNLQKNIYSEINNRFMPPAIVAEMTGKYTKIYEDALERLGGIASTEVSLEDNLLKAGLDEMNAMLIAQSIESGAELESIGISDEMKEIAAPIVEEAIAPEMARKVAVPKIYDFSEMMDKYDSELQERISELSKPFTITDAFNRWIEEVEHKFEKAINAMDKDADPIPNNEYYGMSQERITADIHYWNKLKDEKR